MNKGGTLERREPRLGWALLLGMALIGQAQAAGRFELKTMTVDAGGQHSQGTRFAIEGTAGQHDAAPRLQGPRFSVSGGFWPAATAPTSANSGIFSNGFEG